MSFQFPGNQSKSAVVLRSDLPSVKFLFSRVFCFLNCYIKHQESFLKAYKIPQLHFNSFLRTWYDIMFALNMQTVDFMRTVDLNAKFSIITYVLHMKRSYLTFV